MPLTDEILDETAAEKYLLGELNADEAFDFEAKVFANEDLSEELEICRHELAEKYLCSQLTGEKEQRFERYFLSFPYHQQIYQFQKSLLAEVSETKKIVISANEESKGFLAWLMDILSFKTLAVPAFATLFLIVLGGLIFNNYRKVDEVAKQVTPTPTVEKTPEITPTPGVTATANNNGSQPSNTENNSQPNVNKPVNKNTANNFAPTVTPTAKKPDNQASQPVFAYIFLPLVSRDVNAKESVLNLRKTDRQTSLEFSYPQENKGQDFKIYKITLENSDGKELTIDEFANDKNQAGKRKRISVATDKFQKGQSVFRIIGIGQNGEVETIQKTKFRVEKMVE